MDNFLKDLQDELGEETPVGVVIGNFNRWYSSEEDDPDEKGVPHGMRNRLISWDEAKPLLGYTYDSGFGGTECHPVYIWTETRVIFISCYDGSTSVCAVPRNPIDSYADMFGGG